MGAAATPPVPDFPEGALGPCCGHAVVMLGVCCACAACATCSLPSTVTQNGRPALLLALTVPVSSAPEPPPEQVLFRPDGAPAPVRGTVAKVEEGAHPEQPTYLVALPGECAMVVIAGAVERRPNAAAKVEDAAPLPFL